MKVRDAIKRLRAVGAVPDRVRGSHGVWTLPNGAHVVLVVNKLNADVTEAQLRTIRQTFRAAGLEFDRP